MSGDPICIYCITPYCYNTRMHAAPLEPHHSPDGQIENLSPSHWRLATAAGPAGEYRLAQLDDYSRLRRNQFPCQPPCTLTLRARASEKNLTGTWGFGFWNDPFGAGLAQGGTRLLPALPQAAWFFFASDENHLSFREGLPAAGPLAGVFHSTRLPVWPFLPFGLAAPLLLSTSVSRLARRAAASIINEQSVSLDGDVTLWHEYHIDWQLDSVRFYVDERVVLESGISPRGPLGLVIWLDNQFAAWRPDGRLNYGTLETKHTWIEVQDLRIT